MNKISVNAERHFYRLLPLPDDHGCCELTPAVVKGLCYPIKDKVTVKEIQKWTQELVDADIVRLWEEKGRLYGYFTTWAEHQRIRSLNKRKTPTPPEHVVNCRQVTTDVADCGSLPSSFSTLPSSLSCPADQPKPKEKIEHKRAKTYAPEKFDVTSQLREWAIQNHLKLNLEKETQKFLNYHGAKATMFSDWSAAWRNWMLKAMEFSGKNSPDPPGPPVMQELSPLARQAQALKNKDKSEGDPSPEDRELNRMKAKEATAAVLAGKTL